jgi:hypothetical protein
LRKVGLALADAKYDRGKWGWSLTPSERDRSDRRIAKLKTRLAALSDHQGTGGAAK